MLSASQWQISLCIRRVSVTFVPKPGVLTWLPCTTLHGLTPGSGAYGIKGLDLQLVLGPLLQALQGDLPLQPVVHQSYAGLTPQVCSQHSDPVAHALRVSVVLGLWQWLPGKHQTIRISQQDYSRRCSLTKGVLISWSVMKMRKKNKHHDFNEYIQWTVKDKKIENNNNNELTMSCRRKI